MEFTIDGIEGSPSEINHDTEINVLFSFKNVTPSKTYYLEGAFQQKSGEHYFGYTWNNNWYQYGEDYTNFYKFEIASSSASSILKIKPDAGADGFKGTGDYQLKLFRFCSSQSSCGETNNVISIRIIGPSPSPSPSSSPPPSPSPNNDTSPSPSSSTSSQSPLPSPKPSLKPSPSSKITPSPEDVMNTAEVLGLQASSIPSESPSPSPEPKKKLFSFSLPVIIILTGAVFLIASATPLLISKLKRT